MHHSLPAHPLTLHPSSPTELAVQARVPNSGHIKLAICYADLDKSEFWEMLPEATASLQDWASFMRHISPDYHHHYSDRPIITITLSYATKPDTNHITTTLTTDLKSATVHHIHHHHSYHPIITTALTTNTKPDNIPLCPTIPDALSTTTKSDTDPNDITITNPETNHICHHTDPNTRTKITTTSDFETVTDSDRPTTDTDTTTPTVTNSDHTVTAMDNLANTTLATNVTSDCSSTDTDATALITKKSGTVPDNLTATDITSPPSINSLLLSFSTIALTITTALTIITVLTATNRQYLTVNIRHCLTSVITNSKTVTNLPTTPTESETISDYLTITFATTTDRITDTDRTTDITKTDTTPDRWYFATTGLHIFLIP
ncbi:hypothetical protein OG21DRAFT_1491780 [Imleria badia]|nr:hypothetical protein OG21DRAFT_1491780 [Imleria badia]